MNVESESSVRDIYKLTPHVLPCWLPFLPLTDGILVSHVANMFVGTDAREKYQGGWETF